MHKNGRRFVSMTLVAAGALGAVNVAFAADSPDRAPEVTVARPKSSAVPQWDDFTGRFEPVQKVEVRARVSGALEEIKFTDGQLVRKGDLLFKIDSRPFEIAVDLAKAEVSRTEAQVVIATNDAARAEQLVGTSSITLRDADQRRAALAVAQAQLRGAQASLRNAELNLEWTEVRAPIAGRVSDRRLDVGNLVEGGQAGASVLTTIVTQNPIHFVFDASEADYLRYARSPAEREKALSGQSKSHVKVRLADEADWGRSREGQMDFIDNQINPRSGTIRGRAVFANEEAVVAPGTFGRIRLLAGTIETLLVPDRAVISDQANKAVLTVGEDNKVRQKPVLLGDMYNGLRVVLGGLEAGDRVIVTGVANPAVRPGVVVRPTDGVVSLSDRHTAN